MASKLHIHIEGCECIDVGLCHRKFCDDFDLGRGIFCGDFDLGHV